MLWYLRPCWRLDAGSRRRRRIAAEAPKQKADQTAETPEPVAVVCEADAPEGGDPPPAPPNGPLESCGAEPVGEEPPAAGGIAFPKIDDIDNALEIIRNEIDKADYQFEDTARLISELEGLLDDPKRYAGGDYWLEEVATRVEALERRYEPKAAEILVFYGCSSTIGMWGKPIDNGIVNLGAYSLPFMYEHIDAANSKLNNILGLLNEIAAADQDGAGAIVKAVFMPKIDAEISKGGEQIDNFRHYIDEEYGKLKAFVGEEP